MPIVDMSLEELKLYRGTNPKPKDFDSFWQDAMNEMNTVDPQTEMVLSDFKTSFADCFDMYFTGVKNARIHAKLLIPKQLEKPAPAVLHFHGYTGDSGDWMDKLPYVAEGFIVAALDCRGQGGKSEDTGGIKGNTFRGHIIRGIDDDKQNMLMRNIYLDTAQTAKIIMNLPEVDEGRVGVMGGSQGGGLSLVCASLVPQIKKVAVMYPFLSDYKRGWDMDLDQSAYEELRTYFRQFDPLHEREGEIFEKLGYLDVHHLAPRIQADVLMAITLMDTVCPPSTQFAAFNNITSSKRAEIYPDYGHEVLPRFNDHAFSFLKSGG